MRLAITGTGLWFPPNSISNEELVETYNQYVDGCRAAAGDDVDEASLPQPSDAEFIQKASGVERRYVLDREGVLDPGRLRPKLRIRSWDEPSVQCEMAVAAATEALAAAGRQGADIDMVIVGCSNLQRAYPAISVEVQAAVGAKGFAYDMNVACSTATFALQAARDSIIGGSASRVLVVNPEICSAHLNFKDRDCHFIFGDACTAFVVEPLTEGPLPEGTFELLSTSARTQFSNNIRNDAGFLSRCEDRDPEDPRIVFKQEGRQVFREVAPMTVKHLREHLEAADVSPEQLKRLWLHQANATMNRHIAKKLLGHEPSEREAPIILDEFANTSSAGSIIAFHRHKDDLAVGDLGILCSFGAGYSIGSALLKRVA